MLVIIQATSCTADGSINWRLVYILKLNINIPEVPGTSLLVIYPTEMLA